MNPVDSDESDAERLDTAVASSDQAVSADSDEMPAKPNFKARVTSWRSGRRFWPSLGIVGFGIAALIGLGFYVSWETNRVDVPDLRGLTVQEAAKEISALGLEFKVAPDLRDDMMNFNEVVSQEPTKGTRASPNSVVAVVVEPRSYDVPTVTGQTLRSAEDLFRESGFDVGVTDYLLPPDVRPDAEGLAALVKSEFGLELEGSIIRGEASVAVVEEWEVVGQKSPGGTQAKAGTRMALSLQVPVTVTPNLVGMTRAEANAAAEVALLAARTASNSFVAAEALAAQASTIQDKVLPPESATWRVTAQDKPAGSALAQETQIFLTLEWPGIAIPSIVGLTNAEAEAAIKEAGFVPKLEIPNPADWRVYKQDPAGGGALLWGSTLTYAVSRPPSGAIEFRVTGNGSSATVTWIPPRSFSIQQATDASIPWSHTFDNYSTIDAYERGNFSAQMHDGDTISCQMIVDGKVVMDHTSTGAYAIVSCG